MSRTNCLLIILILCTPLLACSGEDPVSIDESASAARDTTLQQPSEPAVVELPEVVQEPEAVVDTTPLQPEPADDTMVTEASSEEQSSNETANAEPTRHVVKGVITQWQPLVTYAQPGDSVQFTNMAGHDTQSIEGMIPDGAVHWQSKLGEEAYTITVEQEGAYVYKCNPHITTGMVGIIIVGKVPPDNLDGIEANTGNIKIGGNMVKRAIRKLKKSMEAQ